MTPSNKLLEFLSGNPDILTPSQAARVRAMRESKAQPGALGVGGGCLEVSSAEALCREWRKKSNDHRALARANGETYGGPDLRHTFAADTYLVCESNLRREMKAASKRQPPDNAEISHANPKTP